MAMSCASVTVLKAMGSASYECFAVVATGESAIYANVIQKGVAK